MQPVTRNLICCWLLLSLFVPGPIRGASPPPAIARSGMVAADSAVASAMGSAILQAGGNAVDAAVATALALGVVHPHSSGLGGGGFVLYREGATGDVVVLDFRERAPACATADMFLLDGQVAEGASIFSGLAVGVPGEPAGLWALHQRYGRLPWGELFAPAILLAEEGYVVDDELAQVAESRGELLAERPELDRLFVTDLGLRPGSGERLRNPELAETLRTFAEGGPDAFYSGPVARALVSSIAQAGGCLSTEDLAAYEVRELAPQVGSYGGLTIFTMPPPSSGGITMLQTLGILEPLDLTGLGSGSSSYFHLLAEALQFAFADRAAYLGDPAFVEVPVDLLLDPELAQRRRDMIQLDATLERDDYQLQPSSQLLPEDGGTAHISVVDAERNVVALTTTINHSFGSMILADGLGLLLNNEMDDFVAAPGVPNDFGLIGNAANAVAPGKTPLSSMAPTIVVRDGQPFMVLGASGGPRIISATMQTLLNVVEHGMDISAAVSSPRIHHQWVPERLFLEPEVVADVRSNLSDRGHICEEVSYPLGAVQAIVINGEWLYGASDPRKGGWPVGY